MIKRLRWKMVGINMAIVTAVLLTVFASVFFISRAGLARESTLALEEALQTGTYDPLTPGQAAGSRPCFVAVVYDGGTVRVSGSSYYRFDDEQTLLAIIQDCLDQTDDEGVLRDYQLRYLRVQTPLTTRIAFTDSSGEQSTLRQLLRSSLLLGLGALAVLFGFSYLLSGLAVRPVERAWNEQQRFVSDASHELKTPLTVILTNTELLQSPDYDTAQKQTFLSGIDAMAKQMRALVERLLELARAENEQASLAFTPCDLSQITESSALLFEAALFERGLTLQTELEPDITVSGDERQLSQLVEIYLDNARKYASGGTVAVRLSRCGKNRCRLSVSNEGEALSPQALRQIFDRFSRADAARTRDGSFGLGLSIAQAIAQTHGGSVWAESETGVNTFFAELPMRSGHEKRQEVPKKGI